MASEKGVKGWLGISKNCILGIPHYHSDSQPVVNGSMESVFGPARSAVGGLTNHRIVMAPPNDQCNVYDTHEDYRNGISGVLDQVTTQLNLRSRAKEQEERISEQQKVDKETTEQLNKAMKKFNRSLRRVEEDIYDYKTLCRKHGVRLKLLDDLAQASMMAVLTGMNNEMIEQMEFYGLFRMSATTRKRKWSLEDEIERLKGARESPDAENAQMKARITNPTTKNSAKKRPSSQAATEC